MAMIPVISKFHFYQQIRLLLRKLRNGSTSDAMLLNQKLQISSTLSLDAPDGQVKSLCQTFSDEPIQLTAWYNGLTGAMGALPTVYSEWMIERHYRHSDHSAKAFIDIFGHRLYCLDYLVWQKNHLYARAESQRQPPLQKEILALGGLLIPDASPSIIKHASLFISPVRSMLNLERWLSQLLGVQALVTPFTGGWCDVPEQESCQLGTPRQTLGAAPMIGRRRLDKNAHFDVILGPMSTNASRRFTAQGDDWRVVWSNIRDYVGPVLDFSVSLLISSVDLTPKPLGESALGHELCIGRPLGLHPHQVRLSAPTTFQDDNHVNS